MKEDVKISAIQTNLIWEDTQANLEKFDKFLQKVPDDTEIIILPEMFSTGFTMQVQSLEKPVGKKAFHWLQSQAAGLQKIIVGSILTEYEGKYFNRMFWMHPDGTYEYYDKRHLFSMGGEHRVMTAGERRLVVEHKGWRFLLQICYDLRFPVFSRNKYDKNTDSYDYDTIIYIANWPESRKYAYEHLLKARAIENQAYVVWVNRIGYDNRNVYHSGDTQILDAIGKPIMISNVEMHGRTSIPNIEPHGRVSIDNVIPNAPANKEYILSANLSANDLKKYRNNFKVGLDWDSYSILW